MQAMECVAVCRNTPCPNTPNFSSDFDRFFCGGLQPEVFELDATTGPNWGSVIRSINVGKNGAVNLKPFAFGICAADTAGQVSFERFTLGPLHISTQGKFGWSMTHFEKKRSIEISQHFLSPEYLAVWTDSVIIFTVICLYGPLNFSWFH